MTTSMLKPDKPRRQPKEGSKEAALREMREENVKAVPAEKKRERIAKLQPRVKADPTLASVTKAVADAQEFTCTILKDRRYITRREKSLAAARALMPELEAEASNSRKAMIYAVSPDGMTCFVPNDFPATAAEPIAATQPTSPATPEAGTSTETTMTRNPGSTSKRKSKSNARTAVKAKKTNGSHARYDWTGAEEKAAKGTIPPPPDFSAPTHKYFREVLAEVVKAAKAGDKDALTKIKVKPTSSSTKAVARYRKICLTALSA